MKIYKNTFAEIIKQIPEFKPLYIISDFETGAIHAAKDHFVSAQTQGCYFHFGQSIWRKIQHVGLQTKYSTDPMFALKMRQILALAFVPAIDIPTVFAKLCETPFWSDENEEDEFFEKKQEFLNYFETTYIGIQTRTQAKRRRAIYPPEFWGVYERTLDGLPRTNNSMESWHSAFS